jgi:hypothetical protein
MPDNRDSITFPSLPSALRATFLMALLVLGTGYLFAMVQVYEVHSGRDGKPGLSAQDLIIAYSGKHGATRIESALNGPMRGMLPDNERQTLLAWASSDGSKEGYEAKAKPIMDQYCVACHNGSDPHKPDFTRYEGVSQVVAKDTGMNIPTLVRISHIHMFGMTFIFFIVSTIFSFASMRPQWLKQVIIVIPFLSIVIDIASWYLTKWHTGFAWVVLGSGALMGVSFAIQWTLSVWQIIRSFRLE